MFDYLQATVQKAQQTTKNKTQVNKNIYEQKDTNKPVKIVGETISGIYILILNVSQWQFITGHANNQNILL